MNGETIKINHPLYGLKKSSISTMMSHLFMFELCKVWNSLGIDMYHCTSEASILVPIVWTYSLLFHKFAVIY